MCVSCVLSLSGTPLTWGVKIAMMCVRPTHCLCGDDVPDSTVSGGFRVSISYRSCVHENTLSQMLKSGCNDVPKLRGDPSLWGLVRSRAIPDRADPVLHASHKRSRKKQSFRAVAQRTFTSPRPTWCTWCAIGSPSARDSRP